MALRFDFVPVQLELDPGVLGRDGVLVDQQRPALVGDEHVEDAAVPEVDQGHGAAVVGVGVADRLGDLGELPRAVVEPDLLLLVAREALALHRRPVLGVGDDRAVAAGDHARTRTSSSSPRLGRDVAVGQEQVLSAVVVQVAELRPEAPAAQLDAQRVGEVLVLERVARRPLLGHPEVVPLDQHALLGDVRDVDREPALVEDVAERDVHPALGREADAASACRSRGTTCPCWLANSSETP